LTFERHLLYRTIPATIFRITNRHAKTAGFRIYPTFAPTKPSALTPAGFRSLARQPKRGHQYQHFKFLSFLDALKIATTHSPPLAAGFATACLTGYANPCIESKAAAIWKARTGGRGFSFRTGRVSPHS